MCDLALCPLGTRGKGTLRMYPWGRVPTDGTGKLCYSSVASTGFGNQYVMVHQYFFFAAFFDPRTKSLLKDMMTIVDFRKLKSDIIDVMGTEGLLENQSDKTIMT